MANFKDTLIEQVRQLEDEEKKLPPPPLISSHLYSEEHKGLFENWRQRNQLVDRVVRGETTFSSEFENFYQTLYSKWYQAQLPRIVDENYRKSLGELKDVLGVGRFYDDDITNTIMNPFFFGVLSSIFYIGKPKETSRRQFLKRMLPLPFLMAGIGGILAESKRFNLNYVRRDAAYLDSKVKEIYQR